MRIRLPHCRICGRRGHRGKPGRCRKHLTAAALNPREGRSEDARIEAQLQRIEAEARARKFKRAA